MLFLLDIPKNPIIRIKLFFRFLKLISYLLGRPCFLLIHDGKNTLDRQQMQKIIDSLYTNNKK
ncbi:Uncharacterised protein [Providencia rettgeri]|nr:Uncharacterised protein [Providencia rettgeri]CAC9165612.1 Uncharacterised protein [Providencia rettgeri]